MKKAASLIVLTASIAIMLSGCITTDNFNTNANQNRPKPNNSNSLSY